jgi:hypothetical protein
MPYKMSKDIGLLVDEIIGRMTDRCRMADRDDAIGKVLHALEAQGDARRALTAKDDIKWVATCQLRDHLRDLRREAEEDEEGW